MNLTDQERNRYARHLTLLGGEEGQERLRSKTALITRCGGVGGAAALYLAAAGIGRLILIHEGRTTPSNLNRMILQRDDWIGKQRILQIRESIHRLNRDVEIVGVDGVFDEERGRDWASSADVLLSCSPVWQERVALNAVSVALRIPLVEAAMNGMEGTLTVFIPGQTPCLRCLYPVDPDPDWWDPWGFPVLGSVAGLTGCLAATEAIKVLLKDGDRPSGLVGHPLINQMLLFDLRTHRHRLVTIRRRTDCPSCHHLTIKEN
ncbi:MAG: HesA/MoeB/ThiF family protein [Armatimonadetes bacterium]|nr:HesA/MoeB/ThiF family protein [Armatimonadota bacterium]MDW8121379.1 HesA/MoeB/ThiF family protein [Armatimonadota bacterium]